MAAITAALSSMRSAKRIMRHMAKQKILIINSYAGSLTIAASWSGLDIIGSYEDLGYGLKTQRLNFPKLNYIESEAAWPKQDLHDVMVIAHPPCSAFSQLNVNMPSTQGVDSEAFACTIKVMKYAMENKCKALMIESVPRALEGAREVHDLYAKKYGYSIFRVMQNAASFGVPQWRQRFWCIFLPGKGRHLTLHLRPICKVVGQCVDAWMGAEKNPWVEKEFNKQVAGLRTGGLSSRQVECLFDEGYGRLIDVLARYHGVKNDDKLQLVPRYNLRKFHNGQLTLLKENDFAPVLTGNSVYVLNGKLLPAAAYNVIMGFPPDYKFHTGGHQRTYLSKGVCPPVAEWLLGKVMRMGKDKVKNLQIGDYLAELKDGETATFLPKREEAKKVSLFK
jgi:site-specific DNA-cytosine methylase